MKTFLKIIGVILVLCILLVGYAAYNSASDMRQVQKITKASAEFYTQHKSFDDFCDHTSLSEAKDMGFTVSCQELDNDIALKLTTSGLEYFCQSARTTDGSRQIACIELDIPEVGNSKTSSELASNSFDAKTALPTLTEEPPMCPVESDGFYLARKGLDVKYAVMPGVYSFFLPSDKRASLVTFAIKKDRSICSCSMTEDSTEDSKEAHLFEYGTINEKGHIVWDEGKSWPSDQERLDRVRQKVAEKTKINPNIGYVEEVLPTDRSVTGVFRPKNTLITTISEDGIPLVRAMKLTENGCGGGLLNLFPFEGLTQSEVCGCNGRGVN